MVGVYDITLNDQALGQVTVTKEGLYYQFSCTVRLPEKGRYRLKACYETGNTDLGFCIPQMCTKIPIKRFGKGDYSFILLEESTRIAVDQNQPFPYLDRLPNARFYRENGNAYIVLNPKASNKV